MSVTSLKNYKNLHAFFLILLCFSFSSLIHAKDVVSPTHIEGTQKVSAETLISHVENMPSLVIIDSRIKSDRPQGYIEGSISLPDEETSCATLTEILTHKKSPVIFYCNGPKCGRSAIAVKVAVLCGYTNTYWFRGGFEEWKQKKYPYLTD